MECWSNGVMSNRLHVTGHHILDFGMRIAEFNVLNI
jgi:hypothetical protein